MKKQTFISIIILLFALQFSVNGQNDNPDAIYQKVIKEYTLHKDGSYDLHYYKQLELLSHFAMNRLYGETFIVYNPDFQKLKINQSYTVMKDGKKIITPKNAFNEVLPRNAKRFPDYNHLREMVVTHTGLEVGATIYLDYTLKTSAKMFDGAFAFFDDLNKRSPIQNMEIIVHVPQGVELLSQIRNMRLGAEITEKGDVKTYRWKFNYIKPNLPSAIGNNCSENDPMLFVCNKQATQQVLRLDHNEAVPQELMKAIKTRIQDKNNVYAKILAIKDFLNQHFEASHLNQKYIGHTIRSFDKILKSNIITSAEKNILLAAILSEIGIKAQPILAYSNDGLPFANQESYFLTLITHEKDVPYLINVNSREDENLFFTFSNNYQYIDLKTNKIVKLPENKYSNKYETKMFLEVTTDTIQGKATLYLNNRMNPFITLSEDAQKAKHLLKHIQADDVEVKKLTSTNSTLEMNVHGKPAIVLKKDLQFDLPYISNSIRDWHLQMFTKRRHGYEIPFPIDATEYYEIKTTGVKCINKDFSYENQTEFGKIFISLKVKKDKVIVTKQISLNKTCYPYKDYKLLREFIHAFDNDQVNKLYFMFF